jgi:hypothetical protein
MRPYKKRCVLRLFELVLAYSSTYATHALKKGQKEAVRRAYIERASRHRHRHRHTDTETNTCAAPGHAAEDRMLLNVLALFLASQRMLCEKEKNKK